MAIIYLVGSRCKAIDIYDREKLYEEVWNESVTIVARKYSVSGVAIKKACKKMNVPTPRVGYWQKTKLGASWP
jgi:hypothetical protein